MDTSHQSRQVTDKDVSKYIKLVNFYINKNVLKNWNEARLFDEHHDVTLGNSGISINDIRQQLLAEVVVALQKYDPDYRTKAGSPVKESTFVYGHLWKRCGQLMKKLTNANKGYGVWSLNVDSIISDDNDIPVPSFSESENSREYDWIVYKLKKDGENDPDLLDAVYSYLKKLEGCKIGFISGKTIDKITNEHINKFIHEIKKIIAEDHS